MRTLGLILVQYSDTTAAALVFLFYRLARHSEHILKVQEELDTADDIEDFDTLQKSPHLNGVIHETLRLHPGVPTGGLRERHRLGVPSYVGVLFSEIPSFAIQGTRSVDVSTSERRPFVKVDRR